MVMKPEPWGAALDAIVPAGQQARLIVPTPAGIPFSQALAAQYAAEPWLVFACGRYEGIDARVAAGCPVPDGRGRGQHRRLRPARRRGGGAGHRRGRVPAAARRDGQRRSPPPDDSFGGGRRADGRAGRGPGLHPAADLARPEVPPVLLSGDHAAIARWRRDCALQRTAENRPDLVERLLEEPPPASGRPADGPPDRSATMIGRCSRRLAFRLRPRYGTLKAAASPQEHSAGALPGAFAR